MALSRRKFTKELKVVAIQRLDAGASVAELARAFEVNPNLLHRWRKEFRHGPGKAFPEGGKRHASSRTRSPAQQRMCRS